MLSKCFACGLALFILVSFEFAASKNRNDDLPLVYQNRTVSTVHQTTFTRSESPPDYYLSEFRYSLWQITEASYRYGNTDRLNGVLYSLLDTRETYIDLDPSVEDELHQLLIRLTLEKLQPEQPQLPKWSRNQFRIVSEISTRSHYVVYYSTQAKSDDSAFQIHCFGSALPLINLPEKTFFFVGKSCLRSPSTIRLPHATLPDPEPDLSPDLNLDFLNITRHPDPRVF